LSAIAVWIAARQSSFPVDPQAAFIAALSSAVTRLSAIAALIVATQFSEGTAAADWAMLSAPIPATPSIAKPATIAKIVVLFIANAKTE
jgi:hypothetical protein